MATTKKYVSLDKLGLYDEKIKKVISDGDAATLASAQQFASGLADNYEAAGTVASAKAELEGKIATAQSAAEAADAKAVAAQDEVDALELVVADKADQSALDELDAYVGDIPDGYEETNIVAYINKKAEETLNSASGGSSESAASVLQALNTYKAENDPKVTANTTGVAEAKEAADNAQAAADAAQAHSEGVAADLAEAVEALEGADDAQVERIAALESTIVGLSGAMHFEGVKDEVPESVEGYEQGDVIIVGNKEYVVNGDAFVEFGDATVNAEAITALTGRVDGLADDMTQAQTDIDAVEAAVATKAEQTALDEAVDALEAADAGIIERLAVVEAELAGEGEGTVADQIAAAKQAAIDAAAADAAAKDAEILAQAKQYADDEDAKIETRVDALESASATHALAADLTALADRVEVAEGEIDTLKTEMDAVEAKAAANETAIGTLQTAVDAKASQTDLEAAVARIAVNETAIASFVEVSEEDINSLFSENA